MGNIKKTLQDSKFARWIALAIVSFAMLTAYLFMEIISPLQTMIQNAYGWDNTSWGIVTGAQGYLNVFAFMLIIGGIVLDKLGVRFTAVASAAVMLIGAAIKYYAFITVFAQDATIFGVKSQVFIAASGFAIFAVGAETAGITVSKIIVKWFKGKELALAMGLEMASARLGSFFALYFSPKIAQEINIPAPILMGMVALLIGLVLFIIYSVMDLKLDKQIKSNDNGDEPEEQFKISDLKYIIRSRGFWYISILCVLFYSAVFPFYKFGPALMVNKYGVLPSEAGNIPSLLPFGTLLLTPLFGTLYDRKGKGATIMILGAVLLIFVHVVLWIPSLTNAATAIGAVIVLGIAFSLVPSAMWPSVPKIINERYLGSAYALIFYIQNWGLMGVPILLGVVTDATNPGVEAQIKAASKVIRTGLEGQGLTSEDIASKVADGIFKQQQAGDLPFYDYSSTWMIFMGLTVLALIFGFLLKRENKRKGYGLEMPNMQK